MKKTLIKSYAKINLSLNVLNKAKDGLHKIQSIVSFLNFYDEINIQQINKEKHIVKFIQLILKIKTPRDTRYQYLYVPGPRLTIPSVSKTSSFNCIRNPSE